MPMGQLLDRLLTQRQTALRFAITFMRLRTCRATIPFCGSGVHYARYVREMSNRPVLSADACFFGNMQAARAGTDRPEPKDL